MLTILFRKNSVMIILLMPDCKAESVIYWFNYLETGLGKEIFHRLFEIGLTDNGSEFKHTRELETTEEGEQRTKVFYCV